MKQQNWCECITQDKDRVSYVTELEHTRCARMYYPGQRVSYVTELEHTRCVRMYYPGQRVSYETKLELTRCVRMYYPGTKSVLCNRTRAYKMRAHALPQDKECLM